MFSMFLFCVKVVFLEHLVVVEIKGGRFDNTIENVFTIGVRAKIMSYYMFSAGLACV